MFGRMHQRISDLAERYGEEGSAELVPDEEYPPPIGALTEAATRMADAAEIITRRQQGESLRVDEYLPQTAVPTSITSLILPPQFERYSEVIKRIIVTGPTATTLGPSTKEGQVTNPGAGATIATLGVLPAGQYTAYWNVGLEGTVTAADADNMKVVLGAANLAHAAFPGVVGEYPQAQFQFTADGVNSVTVVAVAAASGATAIYDAFISVVPTNVAIPFTLQLGNRFWSLSLPPTGVLEFSADILLERNDLRRLTSATAGPWSLELTGEADVRY